MQKIIFALDAYFKANALDVPKVLADAGVSDGVFRACLDGERELMADELLRICIVLNMEPTELIRQAQADA